MLKFTAIFKLDAFAGGLGCLVAFALIQNNGGCILGKAHDTDMVIAATDENGSGAEGASFDLNCGNSRLISPADCAGTGHPPGEGRAAAR